LRISKLLENKSIPMLYVETDYSPDDTGQLTTRIEAFTESLMTKQLYT
jgi:benzoyl-CoA reductase/2-hydroxyglutaryl-CoA dehydratase subunit BcrC/BadD/HgdB